jgi:hypothetical protein
MKDWVGLDFENSPPTPSSPVPVTTYLHYCQYADDDDDDDD